MASDWGADVGKDGGVVSRHGASLVLEVGNDERSLRAWVKGLEAGSRIGVEASGVYHRCLARVATAAGHTVYVLNARDVRHYAKGVGRRAKTDRVDAQVIARYVAHEHEHLRAYSVPTPGQEALAVGDNGGCGHRSDGRQAFQFALGRGIEIYQICRGVQGDGSQALRVGWVLSRIGWFGNFFRHPYPFAILNSGCQVKGIHFGLR